MSYDLPIPSKNQLAVSSATYHAMVGDIDSFLLKRRASSSPAAYNLAADQFVRARLFAMDLVDGVDWSSKDEKRATIRELAELALEKRVI